MNTFTDRPGSRDPRTLLIGAEIFRNSTYGAWHPLRIPRVSTVLDLTRALGWRPPEAYRTAPLAKPAALTGFHRADYIAALRRAETDGEVSAAVRRYYGLGTPSNPVFPEMYRRPATAAGGTLLACEMLVQDGGPRIVHNPAGGTHHGMPARAAGFCYLNDPALAIARLRALGVRRIAYIDIDAHHPDGVVHGFGDCPDVLIVSVHEAGRWPRTGALEDRCAGSVFNLPLPRGAGDAAMDAARERLIVPRLEAHRPDAVILQCGADSVLEDPLSGLACTNAAYLRVVRVVMALAPRLLVLGGGGYNPWSVARCWSAIWGVLSGQRMPDRLPPEAEAVLRAVTWTGHRLARNPPEHWFTTLVDAPRPVPLESEVDRALDLLAAR